MFESGVLGHAIEEEAFKREGLTRRGKGLDGLVKKGPEYWNPVEEALKAGLGLPGRGRDYDATGAAAAASDGAKR